jgi:plastocyanin
MNAPVLRRLLLPSALACVLAFGAACGDSGESTAVPQISAERGDSAQITIRGVAFTPAEIHVEAGTEVRWLNEDSVDHTVTSGIQRKQGVPGVEEDKPARPDGMFDERLPKQGDDFTFTFDAPGTFAYYCDVHAGMTGEITVD